MKIVKKATAECPQCKAIFEFDNKDFWHFRKEMKRLKFLNVFYSHIYCPICNLVFDFSTGEPVDLIEEIEDSAVHKDM